MTTNNEIRQCAESKFGFSPKNAWIAHAKEFYGLDVNPAHNRVGERKWPCPEKRLEQFKDIFKELGLLDK